MTSIDNALDRAWERYSAGHARGRETAFEHLFTAVQLIHCWIKAHEAGAMDRKQPSEAPEASSPPLDPIDWKSRYNRQREATESALYWLRGDYKNKAIEELEKVL